MLVLSRRAGERIWVGSEIEITVLGIRNGRVTLGFVGPPEVSIRRDEVERRSGPDRASQDIVPSGESADSRQRH